MTNPIGHFFNLLITITKRSNKISDKKNSIDSLLLCGPASCVLNRVVLLVFLAWNLGGLKNWESRK